MRAASAAAAAAGRPSLLAPARLPGSWTAVSAAAAGTPEGAARASDIFAFLGPDAPTLVAAAASSGIVLATFRIGQLSAKVAHNEEVAASAKAAAEAKLAAIENAANAAVASAEAKLAATKEATAIVIAAIKESAASAIAATEAKLAAAEKVIARMEASASVAAELATLKAMKSEPKRE